MNLTFSELADAVSGSLLNADPHHTISCVSTDSREKIPNGLFFAIPGERFDGHDFLEAARSNGAALLCIEEGAIEKLPQGAPALVVKSTVKAYQAAAGYYKNKFPGLKTIGLTGSSGKTSTKEMLRAIFVQALGEDHVLATEGNTNNQIGVPANLFRLNENHKIAIIEAGTNHFGEISPLAQIIKPDAAVIVSIGQCHLEHLISLEGVATEKSDLFRSLSADGCAIIPAGCPQNHILEDAADSRHIIHAGASGDIQADYLGGNIDGSSFILKDNRTKESIRVNWHLSGKHQALNAAMAAAAAVEFGIPLKTIAEGLKNCRLPGLRMKKSEHFGATWLNDAYNANPDSMRATLVWLAEFADPEKTILILGDMLEIGENPIQVHEKILKEALNLFPKIKILAVGTQMTEAAGILECNQIIPFRNASDCAIEVEKHVIPGGIVFLKASRGTHLEKVEPENDL